MASTGAQESHGDVVSSRSRIPPESCTATAKRQSESKETVSSLERKRIKNRKATKRFREKEKASKDFIKMMLREMTTKLDGVPDLSSLTHEELKQHWVWMANTTRTLAFAVEHNKFEISPVTDGPAIDLEVGLMNFVPDLPALPTLPPSFPLYPPPAKPTVPQNDHTQ